VLQQFDAGVAADEAGTTGDKYGLGHGTLAFLDRLLCWIGCDVRIDRDYPPNTET
jgi:hypothetical protein